MEEFSGKSSGEWTSRQTKDKTERVIGLSRRTREEIVNWNQMTALKFQTRGETSDIPGLPSGVARKCAKKKKKKSKKKKSTAPLNSVNQSKT